LYTVDLTCNLSRNVSVAVELELNSISIDELASVCIGVVVTREELVQELLFNELPN